MRSYGLTDKGKLRQNNQDTFVITRCSSRNCSIVALCDGMGGANAGDIASGISVRSFVEFVNARLTSRVNKNPVIEKVLKDAVDEANDVAYEYSLFDLSLNGMGTTLVGGIICDDGEAHIVNVGDSRAYLLSSSNVTQITTDHSFVEELVRVGAITREQASTHPQKNVITRALGTEKTVECDYYRLKLNDGERLLLCSDGLSNLVSETEMLSVFSKSGTPEEMCTGLLELTYQHGASDNVTIVVLEK